MSWNDNSNSKFILPQNVPANEFLNFEGKKFSKSRGWGIDVYEFLKLFPADPLRYTLALNLPETKDTDFYWKDFQARNNNELADILGNFVNRTFTFAHKYFEGKVPGVSILASIDEKMISSMKEYPYKISSLLENFKVKDAVFEMMNLAREGNKYFNDSEPWKTVKTDMPQCANTINICLQVIYTLAEIFYPVIPFTSEKIFGMLNAQKTGWFECSGVNLKSGSQLKKAEILFNKIDDSIIDEQKSMTSQTQGVNGAVNLIEYDDFMKAELKVAQILSAENVKKSKKLLRLMVSLGNEERQIVAGIAEHYKPEELVGKKIALVANLKPANIFGLESNGMLLAAKDDEGHLKIVEIDQSIKIGGKIN